MAVVTTKNLSSLKMRFDCGKDDNGKTIVKSRNYSNVDADATDEKVYQVAEMISLLQEHTLIDVAKIDNSTISK